MPNVWYTAAWLSLAAVWLAAAVASKRTIRRETALSRIMYGALFALACILLFQPWRLGPLDSRFVPDARIYAACGLVLTVAGVAFAIWARFALGRNWSGTVTIKQDHVLIRHGPYRFVRHPIYSGILLAMAGTALGYGRAGCLIGLAMALLSLWIKSRKEEEFMIGQFGAQYIQYRREVKALIPGLL
jgi:protein-S-isoprenylcysteine O-methyltransferase Ste14